MKGLKCGKRLFRDIKSFKFGSSKVVLEFASFVGKMQKPVSSGNRNGSLDDEPGSVPDDAGT